MSQVVIENPILNSPYEEPGRHFRFDAFGITNEVAETRRVSSYFVPIARPRMQGQLSFDTEWSQDLVKENTEINRIRTRVGMWRQGGYVGVTSTTRRLLEYWTDPGRERRLFFAQLEAVETIIYITEVARRYGDTWIEARLREANESANPGLYRLASKMATGSGKTVVMAMLVAWQALNKSARPQDARFSDAFLIVTPGITIRDRLRVLLPADPQNYYRRLDLVPPELVTELGKIKMVITNFHSFRLRDQMEASKLAKAVLAGRGSNPARSPLAEMPGQMVRRVLRELGNKRNIIVLNDEAHHCYQHRPNSADGPGASDLRGDERTEIEQREAAAQLWMTGLKAIQAKVGVKAVYDLSATPFFLRGSGYPEGTLFPWVVSDFSLIDAIEAGIVKVPRVPVSDDAATSPMPTYRDLWARISDSLPKRGRRSKGSAQATSEDPRLPAILEGALHSLYGNYGQYYKQWEETYSAQGGSITPPVFIVVAGNTAVSKLLYDYIAGYETPLADGSTVVRAGALPLFSNVRDGRWIARPKTILVDSGQLESGEGMSAEFKKIAAREIEEFKAEFRTRFPGRDPSQLTDEDLLREVMNTVGKPGKLGEHVRCVISVSMLTEGWDVNTVTHILGVRAFSTQLLCEQVVGRALRRTSYAVNGTGKFDPEYAEVYGVPFSFIPAAGSQPAPKLGPMPTRVRALPERARCEIILPRLLGYRYDLPAERLQAEFSNDSFLTLSTGDVPTRTHMMPIVGETAIHTLDDLHARRRQEVEFLLARFLLETHFKDVYGSPKPWLFPQLVRIAREWLDTCVVYKAGTFPQMFLLRELGREAAKRIYESIATSQKGEAVLKPVLRPYDPVVSTRDVDFDTTRPVFATHPDKCHVSHVVSDSLWEQYVAQGFEDMQEVVSYVKNYNLGFTIPYMSGGELRNYVPDFVVRVRTSNGNGSKPYKGVTGHNGMGGHGNGSNGIRIATPSEAGILNLIVEVTGEARKEKAAKVSAARRLWVPAVNSHGGFGRWGFVEVTDPRDTADVIYATLQEAG
jgi:type III restriction enzyme